MSEGEYYTIRGYNRLEHGDISHTMEDYLEMIYRHAREGETMRVKQLAALLHVRPPSASKMAAKLRESKMVAFEPYGAIRLTARGRKTGAYLIHRHEILHMLFCHINRSEDELALVERIEHFVDSRTVANIEGFLKQLANQRPGDDELHKNIPGDP